VVTAVEATPAADARDGLMDVVGLPALRRRLVPGMVASLRRGTHVAERGSRWVGMRTATSSGSSGRERGRAQAPAARLAKTDG
jgi:hypothetical protein